LLLISRVYDLVAFSTNPNLFAIIQKLHLGTHRGDALVAHQHHIRPVDGSLALKDASLPILRIGSRVPLDDIDVFNQHTPFLIQNPKDLADLAPVLSGKNFDLIVFLQSAFGRYHNPILP
jgi:hypothetical protein